MLGFVIPKDLHQHGFANKLTPHVWVILSRQPQELDPCKGAKGHEADGFLTKNRHLFTKKCCSQEKGDSRTASALHGVTTSTE